VRLASAINFGDARLPDRFWDKVQPCPMSGCWLWAGYAISAGYGQLWFGQRTKTGKASPSYAHRVAFEAVVGRIPPDLELDHLCKVRSCVNPLHLEAVSFDTNWRRSSAPSALNATKTQCKRGHEFSADNTAVYKGGRYCKACSAIRGGSRG
jgi:hypothetical protein